MKVISLNTWGGRLYSDLKKFLEENSDTDVFCFQEVNKTAEGEIDLEPDEQPDLFEKIESILSGHNGFYEPQVPATGVATFVKKDLKVESSSKYVMLSPDEWSGALSTPYPRVLQEVVMPEKDLAVFNFHGAPGAEKKDTSFRDLQTDRLIERLQACKGPKVLMGDFNMRPDTKNIERVAGELRNLVSTNDWKTTRSKHYSKIESQPYADYMFVSLDVEVKDFKVMQDVVSDHLPLYVEIAK